jgi:hypothetical protein
MGDPFIFLLDNRNVSHKNLPQIYTITREIARESPAPR